MTTYNKTKVKQFLIKILYDAKNKSSFCWHYFGNLIILEDYKKKQVLNDQVFCNACLTAAQEENDEISFGIAKIRSYSKTVSTGNLNRHLRDVHNIKEESTKKIKRNRQTVKPRTRLKGASTSSINYSSLPLDMVVWFCKSLMPFDSISDDAMIEFFKKYNIIAADLLSKEIVLHTALNEVYEYMLENVKAQIRVDGAKNAAISFDFWSDPLRHVNYITFVLHYLTTDFDSKSFTLSTKLIEDNKTGERFHNILDNIKGMFNLKEKELHHVTDGRTNVKRPTLVSNIDCHLCLGNGLHYLITVDGIRSVPELEELLIKCKRIVKTFRYRLPDVERTTEYEEMECLKSLETISDYVEFDENEPIMCEESDLDSVIENESRNFINNEISLPTRWHILLDMLESMSHCYNRDPINKMLSQLGQYELKITQNQWNILQDLIRFLRKFRDVIKILSTQKKASLNLALIFHLEIKDILNSVVSDEESQIMLSLKSKMLAKLDKRIPITDKIVLAALLDPRFLRLNQIDSYLEGRNITRAGFLAKYIKQFQISISPLPPMQLMTAPSVSSPDESFLLKLSKKHKSNSATSSSIFIWETDEAAQECWKYLTAANESEIKDEDILQYWKENKISYPFLSELARAILAIPATATASELVFSKEGLTVIAKRSRLTPVHVDKVIFIHDNHIVCKDD